MDALPRAPRHVIGEPARFTIALAATTHRFHRDLPRSRVWSYGGHLPGPTIEVRRGIAFEVQWANRLSGVLPVVVTVAPEHAAGGGPAQSVPGRSGGTPDPAAAAPAGLAAPGQQTLDRYENDQRAAMHWYHHPVTGATRFNVYAGLAGLWIVRDDRERELGLPEGPPYELPFLVADRNLDTAPSGGLTGDLLYKTDPGTLEFFGPFTIVNGAIWPQLELEPATYRFRPLNGSNARTYRLVLTREGDPDRHRITQIGTTGGLLPVPAPFPERGLVLAPGESADLLIDLSDLSAGTELTLWNTARIPFDGSFADPGAADLQGLLPYPEVLRIRVVPA